MILEPVQSSRTLVASMAAGTDLVSTAVVGNFESWAGFCSAEDQQPSSGDLEPIEFRVRCVDAPTRRLRLTGARYTLGNGVGCSIRLDDPSLRPLHAVLIRDKQRVLIRAYSVPFLINNRRCNEGLLTVGDVLRLGAYEFELMPLASLARIPHETAVAIQKVLSPVTSVQDDLAIRQKTLDERARELEGQVKELRERESGLKVQEQAAMEVHAEFSRRHEELLSRQTKFAAEQAEFNAQREELRRRRQELQSHDQIQQQEVSQLLGEQEQLIRQNHDTQQQLELSQEQVAIATRSIEQMRAKFASLNDQLRELAQQQASLEEQQELRAREHQRQARVFTSQVENALASADLLRIERDQAHLQRDELVKEQKAWQINESELRDRLDSLQAELRTVRKEADGLRRDCQIARDSICELESLVKEHQDHHESDRSSWTQEVDQMRAGVEQLSLDLAAAQAQISQLRTDNDRLSEQLNEANSQREILVKERDDWKLKFRSADEERRDAERLARDARSLVDQTNREHAQTLQQIEQMEAQTRQVVEQQPLPVPSKPVPVQVVDLPKVPFNDIVSLSSHDPEQPSVEWQPTESADHSNLPNPVSDDPWPSYADTKSVAETPNAWSVVDDLQASSNMTDSSIESETPYEAHTFGEKFANDEPVPVWPSNDQPVVNKSEWQVETHRGTLDDEPVSASPLNPLDNHSDAPSDRSLVAGSLAEQLIRDLQQDRGTQLFGHSPSLGDVDNIDDLDSEFPHGSTQMWNPDEQSSQISSWKAPQPDLESLDEVEDNQASVETAPVSSTDKVASIEPADEDSIEAYMNRLLQRVQGQSSSVSTPIVTAKPAPAPVNQTQSLQLKMMDEPVVAPETRVTESVVDNDAPMIPRSQAPEKTTNLSAMRELANESARSAIHRSAKSQSRNTQVQAFVKFAQAGVAILCGIAAMAMVKGNFKMIAAAAALVIAGVCVREGWMLMSVSRERRSVSAGSNEPTNDNC